MKKLFIMAFAAATAICAQAQLYVVGNGSGMTWDLPGQTVDANADGSYTINLSACDQFKVSKNNSTAWDGEGAYNAGALYPSTPFDDTVYSPNGQTVTTVTNGENISLPANGRYTITISADLSTMTAKANFSKPTTATPVFVRGAMNGWGSPADWQLTYDDATQSYSIDCTINANVEFKVADASWGNINYSTNGTITTFGEPITAIYNQQNSKFDETFTGTITLKITNMTSHQATLTFTKSGQKPTFSETMYVIGNVNGAGWAPNNGYAMTKGSEDGVFTATLAIGDELGTGNGYFSFATKLAEGTSDEDYDKMGTRYGSAVENDCKPSYTEPNAITAGTNSFVVPVGTYNMTLSLPAMTLVITKEGGNVDPNPNPNPGSVIYVMGSGEGLSWDDFPGKKIEQGTDGKYTFSINNLVGFKISTVEAYNWDDYNAGAYSTGNALFSDAVAQAGGETLPIENWGENQELPWPGDYTITVDLTAMTMNAYTITPKPEGPVALYIRGDMNSWTAPATWEMAYDDATNTYSFECKGETIIEAGQKFKIADANWGNYNYGNGNLSIMPEKGGSDEVLYKNGNDMAFAENFVGTILFVVDQSGAVATFIPDEDNAVEAIGAAEGEGVYFNLQGVKVLNPERGIFVKVQNGKAEKVVK